MECKIKNRHELISNYMMGELPDDEAKNFEEHYFHCETCFKELKIAEDAINIIAKEGPTIFKPDVHQPLVEAEDKSYKDKNLKNIIRKLIFPNLRTPFRWGIALTSTAVLAIIFFFLFQNKQTTKNEKVISKDEVIIPENQNPLTADTLIKQIDSQNKNDFAVLTEPSFKPATYLEEWITENVRSDNLIDSVFSPEIGEKFYNSNITFQWKMNKVLDGITIKIMNNLEKEIFKSTLDNDQYPKFTVQANPEIFKQTGLYYWRLEDEEEVLYVGKFYFLK